MHDVVQLVPRPADDPGYHATDVCGCGDFRAKHRDLPNQLPGAGTCRNPGCDCTRGHDYRMINVRRDHE